MSFPSTVATPLAPELPTRPGAKVRGPRRVRARTALLAHGEPLVWLTAGALATALFMIAGILLLIVSAGTSTFWPQPIYEIRLADGRRYWGELTAAEPLRIAPITTSRAGRRESRQLDVAANANPHQRHLCVAE
jgi:hypothetical protein